jgi:integrase
MASIKSRKNRDGSVSWQARIRVRGHKAFSATFDKKSQAEHWAALQEAQIARGKAYGSSGDGYSLTLRQAIERYVEEVSTRKKSYRSERLRGELWKRWNKADYTMADLTPQDFAKWRDARAEQVTANTIRNDLGFIQALYNVARKEWNLSSLNNPVDGIKKPAQPSGRDRRLMAGEEERLIQSANLSDYRAWMPRLIILALETAMRLGELLSLEASNIDLNARVALLPDTKTGKPRRVPLSNRAAECLKDIGEGRLFPIPRSSMEKAWDVVRQMAQVKDLKFHDLRHEAASRLFEKGLNPMQVAAITGHSTMQMLKRYTHLKAEDLAKLLG